MSFRARARRSLSGKPYEGEYIKGDFRNALSETCFFTNMIFDECQMGMASFYKSIFSGCKFESCNLSGANFNGCSFKNCEFHNCTLDQAQFRSANLDTVTFEGGRAEYSTFDDCGAKDVRFNLQLHGADLRFHGASNVDYGDSNLWGATIKVGCKQFVGAKFSQKQLELLVGLISKSQGNDFYRHGLLQFVSSEVQKVLEKITMVTE
jgi:uncharacterized protein YjbI with pentapeptide repeats